MATDATSSRNGTLAVSEGPDRVVVTFCRPQVMNALGVEMVADLHDVCTILEQRPRIAVFTGSDGTFVSGADITQLLTRRRDDALAGINSGLFERIARLPMPTVAAIDGYALGGGAELSYACDLRICTDRTVFGQPEPGLGIIAAGGGLWRLPAYVGLTVAREVVYAGRRLSATEAADLGLVSEVCAPDALLDRAHALVDRMARQSPVALRLSKLAIAMPPGSHPAIDNVAQAILFESEDKTERMTAFLDRKKER